MAGAHTRPGGNGEDTAEAFPCVDAEGAFRDRFVRWLGDFQRCCRSPCLSWDEAIEGLIHMFPYRRCDA